MQPGDDVKRGIDARRHTRGHDDFAVVDHALVVENLGLRRNFAQQIPNYNFSSRYRTPAPGLLLYRGMARNPND